MDTKDRNRLRVTGRRPRRSVSNRPRAETELQIQYTPAKPFNRNRFLLHLATAAAVVLALVFGMSIFFKTAQVTVTGAEKYTPWEVKEASEIQEGDPLLSLSEGKISARIQKKLPYVGDVRVGIKLPDTVNIEIVELQVVYAVADSNGQWYLMDVAGRIVDSTDAADAKNYTQITGVQIQPATIGQQAEAYEQPEGTEEAGSVTVVTVPAIPARQRLETAIAILGALESNGVMGTVDSVDVTEPEALWLSYEDRYRVSLGDTSRLQYKIGAMKAAIQKMGSYQTGYLDVSFTIWPDEVGYRPFDNDKNAKK